jgi:hypothetical protein
MPTIKIDDIEYNLDSLTDQAKSQLQMLHVTEQEIQRLQLQLGIAQTARNAYAQALKAALPTPLEQVMAMGETLKVS